MAEERSLRRFRVASVEMAKRGRRLGTVVSDRCVLKQEILNLVRQGWWP